jgi:HD-GYP domain-containing protein (c-di-GMP phosphodiesterase class II)
MILVPVESLKENMVLGRSVFSDGRELLIAAGFRIKSNIIQRLKETEIRTVWIQEEGTEDVVPEEIISEQVNLQASAAVMDAAEVIGRSMQIREETVDAIEKKMKETDRFKNIVAAPKVQKAVGDMIDSILSQPDVVLNLSTIRSQKSFLYQHAVDVTVTALLIASKLRFSRDELQELGTGCILHDIGLAVIPEKITQKPGRLTFQEYNIIKEHPTYGYAILRENPSIAPTSIHVAYQHHERQDGLGYPRALKGNNLLPMKTLTPEKGYMHRYAEIAAIADAYDAMASPRPYMKPKTPDEIIKQLIVAAGTQLNRAIVDVLISIIPIYPVGSFVVVKEAKSMQLIGAKGVVAQVKKGDFEKPVVIFIRDAKDNKITPPLKMDLMHNPDVVIQFLPLKNSLSEAG